MRTPIRLTAPGCCCASTASGAARNSRTTMAVSLVIVDLTGLTTIAPVDGSRPSPSAEMNVDVNPRGTHRWSVNARSSASLAVDSVLSTPPISLHVDALGHLVTHYRVMTKP